MEVICLQSGSSGNCIYVETDDVKLLFDAGISGSQTEQRLAHHGKDVRAVDALIISHDHRDHTACMGILHRKYGIPIHISEPTLKTVERTMDLGRVDEVELFQSGDSFSVGNVTIETIPTPHDAVDGVAFVVEDHQHRFGVLTDLGHVFPELEDVVASLDAVIIESNYDEAMLRRSPYPDFLKKRIHGPQGHISNLDAARLLHEAASEKLQWACLAHLSDESNCPDLALETHRNVLGTGFELLCADRKNSTEVLKISEFFDGFDRLSPKCNRLRAQQQTFTW